MWPTIEGEKPYPFRPSSQNINNELARIIDGTDAKPAGIPFTRLNYVK